MFWQKQAYDIAFKLTKGSHFHRDLVSHVFILLSKYDIPEKDLPRAFARFAYNQWTWPESEFNRLFRDKYHSEDVTEFLPARDEDHLPSDAQLILEQYLERDTDDDTEFFCREVTKMYLCGMTYREIRAETGLCLDIIHKAIKQFKYDFYNTITRNRSSKGIDDSSSPGY